MYPRKIESSFGIPPGETIRETLDALGLTPPELAECLGMSEGDMSRLLAGERALTDDIAEGLERELGVPAGFWRRLEGLYREREPI
ncbi:MAG: helix-turn-helix transcriptional regulator [Armatimonadota bacterium]|jgi:HTH-type transcriptional regulator/antitoxin HigA